MIPRAQQGEDQRTNGRHTGGEADAFATAFHPGYFLLQCPNGWIDLSAVAIARLSTLKYGGQIARIFVPIGHAVVNWLMEGPMFDQIAPISMNDLCGKSFQWLPFQPPPARLRSNDVKLAQ